MAGPAVTLVTDVVLGADETGESAEYWLYAELSARGAVVTRLQLNRYNNEDRSGPLVLLQEEPANSHSYMLATEQHPELVDAIWDVVVSSPGEVVFRTLVRDGALQIEKRFLLEKNSPLIKLEVAIRNRSDMPLNGVSYSLNSGNGLPIENVHESLYGRNAVIATSDDGSAISFARLSPFDISQDNSQEVRGVPVVFWGTECQFFASVIINPPGADSAQRISVVSPVSIPSANVHLSSVVVYADSQTIDLKPDTEVVHEYLLFNGPKDYPLLDEYAQYDLPLLAGGGDFLFISVKYIARPIDAVLRFVGSRIGDYGLALILTTILIRFGMLPLTYRQRCNSAKILRLEPQLKQLKEQHAKDRDALAKSQIDLYKRYNVNPFGGCIFSMAVALLFIAAWQGLLGSFPLRQADLLWGVTWIHDLSAPDRLFPFGRDVFLLGSHFNLLPTVVLVLMIAGYSMHADGNPSGDAKKRKFFWPVFFCALGYTLPAASWLCVVTFIVGARVEQILLPVPEPGGLETTGPASSDDADEHPVV